MTPLVITIFSLAAGGLLTGLAPLFGGLPPLPPPTVFGLVFLALECESRWRLAALPVLGVLADVQAGTPIGAGLGAALLIYTGLVVWARLSPNQGWRRYTLAAPVAALLLQFLPALLIVAARPDFNLRGLTWGWGSLAMTVLLAPPAYYFFNRLERLAATREQLRVER